jgi:hypothetical protein
MTVDFGFTSSLSTPSYDASHRAFESDGRRRKQGPVVRPEGVRRSEADHFLNTSKRSILQIVEEMMVELVTDGGRPRT